VTVLLKPGAIETGFGVNAVLGITPSCTHRRQATSNAGVIEPLLQKSRTRSYAGRSGRSLIVAISSCADVLSYSGAISGWMIDAVPSNPRASLQDSRKCDSGICH